MVITQSQATLDRGTKDPSHLAAMVALVEVLVVAMAVATVVEPVVSLHHHLTAVLRAMVAMVAADGEPENYQRKMFN